MGKLDVDKELRNMFWISILMLIGLSIEPVVRIVRFILR